MARRRWRDAAAAAAVVVALSGCSARPALLAGRPPCTAASLLEASNGWAASPPERLEAELAAARTAFERGGGVCDRFRVALLSFYATSVKHDAQAAKLLEEHLAAEPAETALSGLARLLLRAFRDGIEAGAQARAAGRRLAEEQARADAAQRQLEELKNIERILKERERQ